MNFNNSFSSPFKKSLNQIEPEDCPKSNSYNNFLMQYAAEEKKFSQPGFWGPGNFGEKKTGLSNHLKSELNQEYYEKWEKNISLEEATDNNEPAIKVAVEGISTILPETFSVVFQRQFEKQLQAKEFLAIVKGLSTVMCASQSQEFPSWSYQGNITQVYSEKKAGFINCYVEIKFSFDRFQAIQDNSKENEIGWSIEEMKLSFYQQMRKNLNDLKWSPRHEEIIVQNVEPKIDQYMDLDTADLYETFVEKLNEDQKAAVKNCLMARNYNLVLGMPGTGKTHVIVILLKILIESDKKVLVTAHTHNAIDNILKRFVEEFPEDQDKVVRLGSPNSVDQEVLHLVHSGTLMDEEKMIFAVTCLGVNNRLLRINFDVCIVDEASQIVEPVLIGPLVKAKRFVLFGDHNQLCPLVKSEEAKEGGMRVSLFEKLAKAHLSSISNLTIQYRMNEDLMRFSNQVIYRNLMKCANEQVKTGEIQLKPKESGDVEWVQNVLDPSKSVVFLDLEKVCVMHDEDQRNLNCSLACFLVRKLESRGVKEEDIGIISPLRDDRNAVQNSLKNLPKVNRYTIDTCQGINKSCIILNIGLNTNRVRSLLASSKRVNVAFTRAKHKLIVIGLFNELREMEGIGSFIRLFDHERDVREVFDLKMLQEAEILPTKDCSKKITRTFK